MAQLLNYFHFAVFVLLFFTHWFSSFYLSIFSPFVHTRRSAPRLAGLRPAGHRLAGWPSASSSPPCSGGGGGCRLPSVTASRMDRTRLALPFLRLVYRYRCVSFSLLATVFLSWGSWVEKWLCINVGTFNRLMLYDVETVRLSSSS